MKRIKVDAPLAECNIDRTCSGTRIGVASATVASPFHLTGKALLLALPMLMAGASSLAQAFRVQPEVEASVVAGEVTAASAAGQTQSDVALVLNPRITIRSRGGRAAIDGTFGVRATAYANHTQEARASPLGRLGFRGELIEQTAFIDASVSADRTNADPFAPRPEGASTVNDSTSMQYRVSPYIERSLTPSFTVTARTDHIISRRIGESSPSIFNSDRYEQAQTLSLDQRPRPLGWRAELLRQDSRARGSDTSTLAQTGARLTLDYQPTLQVVVGATWGRERSEYSLIAHTSSIKGAHLDWKPTERGQLSARIENRYFGTGGELAWQHRTPFCGFTVRALRAPMAQTESRLLGAAGDNVSSLLDAVLTTRYPDPGQRSSAVTDIVRQLNLPPTLTGPIDLHTSYAQLQESASAAVLFYGRLTTAAFRVFGLRQERLVDLADVLAANTFDSDNAQFGGEVEITRQVAPMVSLNGGVRYNRIEGVGTREGQASRDISLHIGITRILNPATRVSAALRHQNLSSNVTYNYRETTMSAALLHTF